MIRFHIFLELLLPPIYFPFGNDMLPVEKLLLGFEILQSIFPTWIKHRRIDNDLMHAKLHLKWIWFKCSIELVYEPFITVDSVSHMVSSVIRDGDVDRRRFTLTNLKNRILKGEYRKIKNAKMEWISVFVNRDNSNGLSLSTNAKYALSNGLFQTLFGRFQTEL